MELDITHCKDGKDSHEWEERPWIDSGTQYGTVQVCKKCGYY